MSVGEQVWAGQGSSEQSVHPSRYGWNGRHLSLLLQSNAYPSNAAAEAIFQELWWITKKFLFQNKSSNSLSLSLPRYKDKCIPKRYRVDIISQYFKNAHQGSENNEEICRPKQIH